MMIKPTKRQIELGLLLANWFVCDEEGKTIGVKKDAPKIIVDCYKEWDTYRQKNAKRRAYWNS